MLDLSCNKIKDEGIKILSEVLKVNSSLTCLDLSRNKIKNINVLKKVNFKNLETLDLENNKISDIKVFDNKAQITLKEERGSTPKIIVYFSKIQIAFEISDRAKAIDMANKINRVVTGTNQDLFVKRYLPGTEFIAETLKGTATKFMSVFNKDNEN